ncbi:zinc ribbon domain-containing protein [Pseudomonas guariconensis]|uniref:zinc ribbon domain-containing protein n=1 Tax=Pseudomonas guariconensis TaxID=1288410 RepID=UPI001E50B393|nr:zinc ribbon domain-containing protein [Pseudomonas guariconensis]
MEPSNRATSTKQSQQRYERMVSLPLFLGIVVFPLIFVWFLLRKGHTTQSRVMGFAWLVIHFFFVPIPDILIPNSTSTYTASSSSSTYSTAPAVKQYPESNATYAQVNAEVGCKSTYSDQKKEDIFNAEYKDRWMTWSGEVVLLESDQASLNVDGVGTQDLKVYFADEQAGYNLSKGSHLKVRFLMKSAGGCFLPFSGREATIVR